MKEVAFIVKEDSNLYKNYFISENEKIKFKKLAYEFFKKYDLLNSMESYKFDKDLYMSLTNSEKEIYKSQICKNRDYTGLYKFKHNSDINNKWINEVSSKIDFSALRLNDTWFWDYISNGKYLMFDYNNVIYGYLLDNNHDEIALDDRVKRIKMSEYWKIREEIEENKNKG